MDPRINRCQANWDRVTKLGVYEGMNVLVQVVENGNEWVAGALYFTFKFRDSRLG